MKKDGSNLLNLIITTGDLKELKSEEKQFPKRRQVLFSEKRKGPR